MDNHDWIEEVLEDITRYAEINGLVGLSPLVLAAAKAARQERQNRQSVGCDNCPVAHLKLVKG